MIYVALTKMNVLQGNRFTRLNLDRFNNHRNLELAATHDWHF
jgi:hypothetical protein